MKKFYLLLIFITGSTSTYSQMDMANGLVFGNEWIKSEQNYFHFTIKEEGWYSIDYETLENAGIPTQSIAGSSYQLYRMGSQVPIIVENEGPLNLGDKIQFYAYGNDGELDRQLYQNPNEEQLNPDYSLFNDEIHYYLSWDTNTSNQRFQVQDNDIVDHGIVQDEYYIHEEKITYSQYHHKPTRSQDAKIRYSHFDIGEGFGSPLRVERSFDFKVSDVYLPGPAPSIDLRFTGNGVEHLATLTINGQEIMRDSFDVTSDYYELKNWNITFDDDLLTPDMDVELLGNKSINDKYVVASALLRYPRTFNFENQSYYRFKMPKESFDGYIEIENFDTEGEILLIDIANKKYLTPVIENGVAKIILPGGNLEKDLLLVNTSKEEIQVTSLSTHEFEKYNESSVNYLIISNTELYGDDTAVNWVEEYSRYRSSTEGGDFDTKIIDINELYHQFAFGIERHSLAIQNFSQYAKNIWPKLEYIFIIGKGREYQSIRTDEDLNDPSKSKLLIPTFGNPGSDNLLVAKKGENFPSVAVGRLAAQSPDHVRLYLDKVKLHENPLSDNQSIEDQLWRKRMIHLSGGDPSLQEAIYNALKGMENIIERSRAGADVFTVRKFTADDLQTAQSQEILDRINAGVSMITFFGHSSTGGFDFSLEDPRKYENLGRYHTILSLGCLSGNIHTSTEGLSEEFVFVEEKGAIAFIASSSNAFVPHLNNLADGIYDAAGNEQYLEPLGKIVQQEIQERSSFESISFVTLNQQMTFHGDPAIKLYKNEDPDYVIDFNSVGVSPDVVNSSLETFDFSFDVINLGSGIVDSLPIQIIHELPSGEVYDSILIKIASPNFSTTVTQKLDVPNVVGMGKNRLKVQIDPNNTTHEGPSPMAKTNNNMVNALGEEGFCFYILDNGARPIYPEPFAIVNRQDIELKASTSNVFLDEEAFIFEIDTTALFNSQGKLTREILAKGGIISWDPDITYVEDRVYYWRVRPKEINGEEESWATSSFIYKSGEKTGWNQSHYYQYLANDQSSIFVNNNRRFFFPYSSFDITMDNALYDPNDEPRFNYEGSPTSIRPWKEIQGTNFEGGLCFIVANYLYTVDEWKNEGSGLHGSVNPTMDPEFYFLFPTQTYEQRQKIINFIENVIPEGHEIYAFTMIRDINSDLKIGEWANDSEISGGLNLFSLFEKHGASRFRELQESGELPYTIIFRKGDQVLSEVIGEDINDNAYTSISFSTLGRSGKMKSTIIGPVKSWDKLLWKLTPDSDDSKISINIYGLDELGNETILEKNIQEKSHQLTSLEQGGYSYARIELVSTDEQKREPPQLEYLRIYYEELPDAALDANTNDFEFYKDTLQQGDDLSLGLPIVNYTELDMDSLLVFYMIQDAQNNLISIQNRNAPLLANTTNLLEWSYNTSELKGLYELRIIANPNNDQPEKFSFNNFGTKSFFVQGDNSNPLLDVTFDGRHILDGDIVAANPTIVLELRDDNLLLPITDPSAFELVLEYPSGTRWNVPVDDETISFEPADETSNENKAKLIFKPELNEEGIYTLIAQARDASGNFSGDHAYRVSFEVVFKKAISNVFNYPNPFSSSTQFVFRVTGEVPHQMIIRIMTITGKVVKEITMSELGNVHIGDNITSYRWNGTDEYGNQLANGTYIYQVITKNVDNVNVEKIRNNTQQYFKNNFGKLVIMR